MQRNLQPVARQHDKLGNSLLRVLVRAVHVVPAGDDVREIIRAPVGHDEHLRASLGGGVRVGGLEQRCRLHVGGVELVG